MFNNYSVSPLLDCPYETAQDPSPIVVDLDGNNFDDAFTDVAGGISWDFFGDGGTVQLSWTQKARNIGFLWLDRNGDGKVNNARELFGNYTHQRPPTPEEVKANGVGNAWEPNGFIALAWFDDPANGGNGDGIIDKHDKVYSNLRVWVDTCHCGDSHYGTIYTLPELGIEAISLAYTPSDRTDSYGNQMRYVGSLRMSKPSSKIPTIYDVFFKGGQRTFGEKKPQTKQPKPQMHN